LGGFIEILVIFLLCLTATAQDEIEIPIIPGPDLAPPEVDTIGGEQPILFPVDKVAVTFTWWFEGQPSGGFNQTAWDNAREKEWLEWQELLNQTNITAWV